MAPTTPATLSLNNITDGETIHQRALLLIGQCSSPGTDEDYLTITTYSPTNHPIFPIQNWPISSGHFKALMILSPGTNSLTLQHWSDGQKKASTTLSLTYVPLLQVPPLHLAIMIAKDSPLLIDCPPSKYGGISSTHADLEAAIKKFRMTAYMWQALTAEDMRSKGLGRRSFRLEEEWTSETLSREYLHISGQNSTADHMRSTAKIHLIRSEKKVAELRDANVAQQNEQARKRDELQTYFTTALKSHGGPFASSAHPVVAGLILDSTFSPSQNLILGHAALGASDATGLSLGIFGSHLSYSWPRFIEEIPSCLLDTTVPGDTVGNDNKECGTMWEACSIGQGAFLHQVGNAFGAPHTTGIMARGYAQHWPKSFLSRTSWCERTERDGETVGERTENEARWDICDALSFRALPHFRLPTDEVPTREQLVAEPNIALAERDEEENFLRLVISSPVGIARLKINEVEETEPSVAKPANKLQFTIEELEARFDRTTPLKIEALGMNGKSRIVGNVWRLVSNVSFIRIPGSSIVLQKRSIRSNNHEQRQDDSHDNVWDWAVLLNEKGSDGNLTPATAIDSRVGCLLDGAVVYFQDGHKTHCGPRWSKQGHNHDFGGHASEKSDIPEGVSITKVEVGQNGWELDGLRFHLSNGRHGGYLYDSSNNQTLEPSANDRIIGFYGQSQWGRSFDGIQEFGIITAPKNAELPLSIYDMPELQNIDGGNGPRPDSDQWEENGSEDDDHSETADEEEDEAMDEESEERRKHKADVDLLD